MKSKFLLASACTLRNFYDLRVTMTYQIRWESLSYATAYANFLASLLSKERIWSLSFLMLGILNDHNWLYVYISMSGTKLTDLIRSEMEKVRFGEIWLGHVSRNLLYDVIYIYAHKYVSAHVMHMSCRYGDTEIHINTGDVLRYVLWYMLRQWYLLRQSPPNRLGLLLRYSHTEPKATWTEARFCF